MLMENYRDRKLLKLYTILTGSDLKEEIKDEFIICALYAMRCIDTSRDVFSIDPKHLVDLAKEAIRAYEELCGRGIEEIPVRTICRALLREMSEGSDYRQIHRMSGFDLTETVRERAEHEL